MNTQPNNVSKYIIVIIALLLVIVLVLIAVILYNQMGNNSSQSTGTQISITQAPTFSPVPTLEPAPVVTVPVTATPTPTPEFTFTPAPTDEGDVVWVNLDYLNIRSAPDFSLERITSIPYGTRVTGEIDGLWMYTSWNGVEGYIYCGEVKDTDKPCVVYDPADLWPQE